MLVTAAPFVANKVLPGLAVAPLAVLLRERAPARALAQIHASGTVTLAALVWLAAAAWLPGLVAASFAFGTLAALGRSLTRGLAPALLERPVCCEKATRR